MASSSPALAPRAPTGAATHAAPKRAFFRIMDAWGATDAQARVLLGSPSRSTMYTYKRGAGGELSHDALERVSYVLGIYKDLQLLFPNPAQADGWMRRPERSLRRAFGPRARPGGTGGGSRRRAPHPGRRARPGPVTVARPPLRRVRWTQRAPRHQLPVPAHRRAFERVADPADWDDR
jgi:hypothetical protein